ncbi:MAG: seryl-tRNA synthetase, partial [Paenibacillus sp.]|nr:seryl-tRNA synthetase [Paenibacillus sp.]
MLDIRFIRENQLQLQQTAEQKRIEVSIEELLRTDEERRKMLAEVERLRQERNRLSEDIPRQMRAGNKTGAERLKEQAKAVGLELAENEPVLAGLEQQFRRLMQLVPNIVSPDTPVGATDADNVEVKRVGTPATFAFEPKDHVTLGEMLGLIDIPRGVKTA